MDSRIVAVTYRDVHRLLTDNENFAAKASHPRPAIDPFRAEVLYELADLVRASDGELSQWVPGEGHGLAAVEAGIASAVSQLSGKAVDIPTTVDTVDIPTAVDEVLRWSPPVLEVTRIALNDVTLGEIAIPAGATVMGDISAANRDPSVFDDPQTFDAARFPNPHLSFGRGADYCHGAALARLLIAVALEKALLR